MKKTSVKISSFLLSAVLCIALCSSAFAADLTSQLTGLQNYLKSADNTGFDFSETAFSDNDIDWTVFALARSGVTAYPEYKAYIHAVVEQGFDQLYPSDLARIILAACAYGLDPSNIGGHDLLAALKNVDYAAQTYASSLLFPLLALNFDSEKKADSVLTESIIQSVLLFQLSDGGFPFSSVDSGYGISADIDTTSMAVQALAPYYDRDAAVKEAIDKALVYIKTQQFEDGAFGYTEWNSKSGESTAQVIIALCALGIDPTSTEYTKESGNPVSALSQFINPDTGAGLDYAMTDNTMTSYQILMGYNAYERFLKQTNGIYELESKTDEPTETTVAETGADATENQNSSSETTVQSVEIPKTGSGNAALYSAAALVVFAGIGCCAKRKSA